MDRLAMFSYARATTLLDTKEIINGPSCTLKKRLLTARKDGWLSRVTTKADLKAVEAGCWYSQTHADRVIYFIENYIYHVTGEQAGKLFKLLDWQRYDLETIFGWIKPNELNPEGPFVRRFRRAYIEIPKKNGKTTLAAAIALYLLIGDNEQNPQVFTAATTRSQAGLCFKTAVRMAKESHVIFPNVRILESTHRIKCHLNGGEMQTMSSEAGNEEGVDASGMIIDELHAHKTRKLYDCLRYAGRARAQPLTVVIRTAGVYDPQSIGWEVHKQAKDVIDGASEDISLMARVYCADIETEDLSSSKVWEKANPSLGKSFRISDFRDDYNEALKYPDKWNNFCRYLLNIWANTVEAWIPIEPILTHVDKGLLETSFKRDGSVDCTVVGIDLASTRDMGAVVLLQRLKNGTYRQKEWYFVPEGQTTPACNNSNRDMYRQWVQDGYLTATPGDVINYRSIFDLIRQIDKECCIDLICVDPWNATQLITDLTEDFGKRYVHKVRQGYVTMSPTMKQFEIILFSDQWKHSGNPITTYCFSNCGKKDDGKGNIMPIKIANENKIDGVSATLTALNGAMYLDNLYNRNIPQNSTQ